MLLVSPPIACHQAWAKKTMCNAVDVCRYRGKGNYCLPCLYKSEEESEDILIIHSVHSDQYPLAEAMVIIFAANVTDADKSGELYAHISWQPARVGPGRSLPVIF